MDTNQRPPVRWVRASRIAEKALEIATAADMTLEVARGALQLRSENRAERLAELAEGACEKLVRLSAQVHSFGDAKTDEMARRAAYSLISLALAGDGRAVELWVHLALIVRPGVSDPLPPQRFVSHLLASLAGTKASLSFQGSILAREASKACFLRDIARACCMDHRRPKWPQTRPQPHQRCLFVVHEGHSLILPRISWHVAELVETRRTRCSAIYQHRLGPSQSGGPACGQILDYPLDRIVEMLPTKDRR